MMDFEPDIDLFRIRAHEGRQDRAWEELVFQLWSEKSRGNAEVRKTKAPDAGVEWYSVYPDGHVEGFQAKFYASLKSSLSGMKESVSAVIRNRPNLTKLTFLVPFDLTDTGNSTRKSDQDRWEEAVRQWQSLAAEENREIEFEIVRGGEIKNELVLEKHTGRRQFWFGDLGFSDQWFEEKFNDAKIEAHGRYTPDADVPTRVSFILDAARGHPSFAADLLKLAHELMNEANAFPWADNGIDDWQETVYALRDLLKSEVKDAEVWNPLSPLAPEVWLRRLEEIVELFQNKLSVLSSSGEANTETHGKLHFLENALMNLSNRLQDDSVKIYSDGVLAIYGPAGQGKTHALLNTVERHLGTGGKGLVIFGSWIGSGYWWRHVSERLGIPKVPLDTFLQSLDSLGGASGKRVVIAFDALNESKAPFDWPDPLRILVAKVKQFENISLILSCRTEYLEELMSDLNIGVEVHPGFEGTVEKAVQSYRRKFNISQPVPRLDSGSFANPLFLRLYCKVLAGREKSLMQPLTHLEVFQEYLQVRVREVKRNLGISLTNPVVESAIQLVAQLLLETGELDNDREQVESQIDALLPSRTEYPRTLFQQMVDCGILEVRKTYGNREAVGFLFQAVSDYVLGKRVVDESFGYVKDFKSELLRYPNLWPTIALILVEQKSVELSDFVAAEDSPHWYHEALSSSLKFRQKTVVGEKALKFLTEGLESHDWAPKYVSSMCALAAIPDHPANSNFLTQRYISLRMCDRDAEWGVGSYFLEESPEFSSLLNELYNDSREQSVERVFLACQLLTWLLASPNRYMRDVSSKVLAGVWARWPVVNLKILEIFDGCDDPYIVERILTCTYGALLQGVNPDRSKQLEVVRFISDHFREPAKYDVLARDSIRGIIAWAREQLGLEEQELPDFGSTLGLSFPEEPPSEKELEDSYGALYENGDLLLRRASSILFSALPNRGDFSVKTIKGDVHQFQDFVDGRGKVNFIDPKSSEQKSPIDHLYEFSCRWVANKAISLGWTDERFEYFETSHDFSQGRTSHKRERFGKKYQWIAHRELLARLCDHLLLNVYGNGREWVLNEGAWDFFLRDLDPSLPVSDGCEGVRVCLLAQPNPESEPQLEIRKPSLDAKSSELEWIREQKDLPSAEDILRPALAGRKKVALRLDASWVRKSPGYFLREKAIFRHQYLLQGSWLVDKGNGADLAEYLQFRGLMNRPLDFSQTPFQAYLGESEHVGPRLKFPSAQRELFVTDVRNDKQTRYWPSSQSYIWEGNTLDCSLDKGVRIETPAQLLLGDATWVPNTAQWQSDGNVIAEYRDYSFYGQDTQILICDEGWLEGRLNCLQMDLVVACLAERETKNPSRDDSRGILSKEYIYTGLYSADREPKLVGPMLVDDERRQKAVENYTMRVRDGGEGEQFMRYFQQLLEDE